VLHRPEHLRTEIDARLKGSEGPTRV
jgi:hypothetical protein